MTNFQQTTAWLRGGFGFFQFFFALFGDAGGFAFFAFYHLLLYQHVPHGVAGLGALADPVLNTIGLKVNGWRLGARVKRAQILQKRPPRVACFFGHNQPVQWLFSLARAAQSDA